MGFYHADFAECAAELRRRVGFIAQIMQSMPRSYAEEWVFIAQIMQSVPQSFDNEWVFITQISGSMPQSRAEEWGLSRRVALVG